MEEEGAPPRQPGNQDPLLHEQGELDASYGTFTTDSEPISFEEKVARAVSQILEEKEKQARQLAEMKVLEEKKTSRTTRRERKKAKGN